MRREPRTKIVHPRKDELKRLGNEINAAKLIVSNLKSEAISVKKEFVGYGDERKDLLKKIDDTKASLKDEELLLVEKKKEVEVVNSEISKKNTELGASAHDLQLMEGDIKNLASDYVELGINLAKQHDKKEKELADLIERIDEKSKFYQKNIDVLFNQQDHLTMQVSLREIDLARLTNKIEEKKVELEKIENQIQNAVDSLEKSSQFAKKTDSELKEKIVQFNISSEELKEIEDKVKKAEKKIEEQKEHNASLVQREVALEKREAKVKAIYQKVGIDKRI